MIIPSTRPPHESSPRPTPARLISTVLLCATLLVACGKSETPKTKPPAPAGPGATTANPTPAPGTPSTPSTPAAPSPSTAPAPGSSAPSPSPALAPAPTPAAAPPNSPPPAGVTLPAGWYAVFTGPGAAGNTEIRTYSPYASFAVAPDQTIEPSLKSTGWTAAYSGLIDIEEPGQYRFAVESEGGQTTLTVFDQSAAEIAKGKTTVPGKSITEWIKLPAGKVQLTIRFNQGAGSASAGAGTGPRGARLRTLWEMERGSMGTGFYPEPIPTTRVSAPKFGASFAAAGYAAQQGRVLIGELGCAQCHTAPAQASTALLAHTGPTLGEIGRRANPQWLTQWIMSPHDVRPNSTMPDVIGDTDKDKADALAITHFLVAPYHDAASWSQAVATESSVLARGRELYHSVGCLQCHGALESPQAVFGDPGLSAAVPSPKVPIPHGKIGGKWNPTELSAFLKDPLKTRPSGRMPSLVLTDEEADLLATYLISAWPKPETLATAFKVDPALVEVGKAAFAARGCANCHDMGANVPNTPSTLKAPALAALTGAAASRGCMDPASTNTPRFTLDDTARALIKAGIEAANRSTGVPAPLDAEARAVAAMNCRACHAKDGQGGVPSSLRPYLRTVIEIDLGDEGRIPPHLNLTGWKLNTPWLREVLTQAGRARPYMATRMPQFGEANVGWLAPALGCVAGVWPDTDSTEPKSSDDTVVAGRQLVGDGGLNCISCHAFGKLPPAGAPGPNIAQFASRLRYDWWQSYALGPARQKPGTRMPAFFATGKSTKTDILGGDPDKQINAMWTYFNLTGFAPPPSGVQTGKGLSLAVGDKPRIFRTFMKDAGSRGIAVGFPVGTHFGFDASTARLVDAWKGDFIDASGAWANRGGAEATGQGPVFWKAPAGRALVIAASAPSPWPAADSPGDPVKFHGYRLDPAGVPTFLYSIGSAEVEETFTPAGAGIRRAFKVSGVPSGSKVFFLPGPGGLDIRMGAGAAEDAAPASPGGPMAITPKPDSTSVEFSVQITPP